MYSSITPRRSRSSLGDCVVTDMPGATGVVHEAGVPLRPSISTRHMRHEPNGIEAIGGAQLGDVDTGQAGGAHDRGALGDRGRSDRRW